MPTTARIVKTHFANGKRCIGSGAKLVGAFASGSRTSTCVCCGAMVATDDDLVVYSAAVETPRAAEAIPSEPACNDCGATVSHVCEGCHDRGWNMGYMPGYRKQVRLVCRCQFGMSEWEPTVWREPGGVYPSK